MPIGDYSYKVYEWWYGHTRRTCSCAEAIIRVELRHIVGDWSNARLLFTGYRLPLDSRSFTYLPATVPIFIRATPRRYWLWTCVYACLSVCVLKKLLSISKDKGTSFCHFVPNSIRAAFSIAACDRQIVVHWVFWALRGCQHCHWSWNKYTYVTTRCTVDNSSFTLV